MPWTHFIIDEKHNCTNYTDERKDQVAIDQHLTEKQIKSIPLLFAYDSLHVDSVTDMLLK